MPAPSSERALVVRDLALQARRLATLQTDEAEKARLTSYAEELEARAGSLEGPESPSTPYQD